MQRPLLFHFSLAAFLWCALPLTALQAQPGKDMDPLSFDRNISGLLNRYCYRCHRGDRPRGDVDLAQDENPNLILQHHHTWRTALDLLESGDMPPESAQQPTDDERTLMVDFLRQTLDKLDCANSTEPGKPILRRLNRVEYDHAVRALTGLDLALAADFPPDPLGYGFDNIGEVLQLSPVQVEQYHEAARQIVSELLASREAQPAAFSEVFFIEPGETLSPPDAARQVIARFATRAFRRPVDEAFVSRLMTIYDRSRAQDIAHDQAIGHMLTAVLISPRFLTRLEQVRADAEGPYLVDDYDLASRLSFFLWSSPPDEELLALAKAGTLNSPEALQSQVTRMLADPRSMAFVDNFFGQWLGLRELETHQPDRTLFPEYDAELGAAMHQEIRLVLAEIVQQDRSLMNLIDADFTYLNQRLARHYGLPDVTGDSLQRVELADHRRGGVLTSAAVLMLQSDPNRTNVPRRGNYIAGTILGDAPPPPPPNVPELAEASDDGTSKTLRQLLELHRAKPECASCHDKIDHLGFGLENFDAIGRWREREGDLAIDASGVLPDGRRFTGPEELKKILLGRRQAYLRTLNEKMLIYALGRGLIPEDDCVVRAALSAGAEHGDRCSAIVTAIVTSYPFRYRRNPD